MDTTCMSKESLNKYHQAKDSPFYLLKEEKMIIKRKDGWALGLGMLPNTTYSLTFLCTGLDLVRQTIYKMSMRDNFD